VYVPEIHEQRKKISGLKMPRRFAPRLPGASTKGQAPINPYGANKMKVASLSDVRRTQLERHALKTASLTEELAFYGAEAEYRQFIKTASVREYGIFLELQKVAERVESPDEFWDYCVTQYGDELEKDAGINAAISAAGKLLTGAGKAPKKAPKKGLLGTKGKVIAGGLGLGGLVGTGMLTAKLDSMGQQQNQMMGQRGFSYGMR